MPTVFRRLRGVVAVGLTWGAVWAAFGAVIGVVALVVSPEVVDQGEGPADIARILGTAGFISGAGFALLLATLERGRGILDVSMARVAAWGVAGGALIPLLTDVANNQAVWTSPLGAVLATSALAIARRAERRQLASTASAALADAQNAGTAHSRATPTLTR